MIAGLVLAAGESSRMGRDKALLTYRGRSFLETIIQGLRDAGVERTVVVLGHHAEEIQRAAKLVQADVVINHDYRQGQTSSLTTGLRALETTDAEAVVLCLVDHPLVSVETLRKLIRTSGKSHPAVVIPTFESRRGHPIVIGRALFEELKSLPPNEGANMVIRKYRHATEFVEVDDRGILLDVDDAETYRQLGET